MVGYRKLLVAVLALVITAVLAFAVRLDTQAASAIGPVVTAFCGANLFGDHKAGG